MSLYDQLSDDTKLTYAMAELDFDLFFRITAPNQPYQFGRHTHKMLEVLQEVSEAVSRGENRYIIINTPPRHGKSDVVSRRWPVWHLNRFPDHEVVEVAYSGDLAVDMSKDARKCYKAAYKAGMLNLPISKDTDNMDKWGIEGKKGGMKAVGFGGSITGRGAHILTIDDYHKNRQEAESPVMKKNVWDGFRNDLITRLSPEGHAVVIVATRWGDDDLVARIENEMKTNPEFPTFEKYTFPAICEVTGEYLFPERFSPKQYETFRAIVGEYAWNSLYMQDPRPKDGNMLNGNNVRIIDRGQEPAGLKWVRGWDLASTAKQRMKDDPDYTAGAKCAYDKASETIYIDDITFGQWAAPHRDKIIKAVAARDRIQGCARMRVEGVAGYKDTVLNLRAALAGKCVVEGVRPVGDKVSTASVVLEPFFDAKHVVLIRGDWNAPFIAQANMFPLGKHDDLIDAVMIALYNEVQDKINSVSHVSIGGM